MSQNNHPIDFGMFIMPFHPPSKPLAQCYDEDLEAIVQADKLGFKEFWIGEHHTMKYESIVMPEIFIGRALGETERIRLGPAPVCLNQHHPAHVASRLAFLDHLSKGRLNLCFGPGSVPADMELYGHEPKHANNMAFEAIEMILKLWESDPPYEVNGKFWKIKLEKYVDEKSGIGYIHKPFQDPHPPISIPGQNRGSTSMRFAGQHGFQPYNHCLPPANVLAELWSTYEEAALVAGRQPNRADWKVARAIFLADTTEEACKLARENSVGGCFNYIGGLLDGSPFGRLMLKRDVEMSNADCNLDYFMQEQIIAGDVDTVLDRLLGLIDEIGTFGTLIMMSYDWEDKKSWLHSMELFAQELMPALNKAVSGVSV